MMSAFEQYGTFDLKKIFSPVIQLARSGWVLDPWSQSQIQIVLETLAKFPSSAALFLTDDGKPLPVGTHMVNKDYADMLQTMLNEGWRTFYNGSIADKIVNAITTDVIQPGVMSREDLAQYRSVHRKPLTTTWKNFTLVGMPMPSSGLTTLGLALNILEQFTSEKICSYDADSYTLVLNALSVAFADRNAWMGDADWVDVPIEGLLEKSYAKLRAALVNVTTVADIAAPGHPSGSGELFGSEEGKESQHTTHFSIADGYGNVAVVTSTIEQIFGSGLVAPGLGIVLNNELTDFSASGRNQITGGRKLRRTALPPDNTSTGGKRPLSSMTPTIVLKGGEPHLLVGSPGGTSIIGVVMDTLLNHLECGKTLVDSVDAGRYISKNNGAWLFEESLFQQESLMDQLRARGANPKQVEGHTTGAVAAIKFMPDGSLEAVADKRKDGSARVSQGTAYP
eukprot:TRINITY_DN2875_c0_g1_i3.p1 TRINITY_DN2875_c0_g1~~TRINITY_DN2875_c0_g1_i3.p1  ORF type:complete len:452 (+),score=93.19 TRINITY_DN2875_c0_g1_i3:513-1868(+)